MTQTIILMFGLLIFWHTLLPLQRSVRPQAELVHRFENGAGDDATIEATLDLAERIRQSGDMAAIRLCTKDPLPLALFTNAISPTLMVARTLTGSASILTPEQIFYLRSEDCLSSNDLAGAGELWFIPKGAALPPSIESVKYCQVQYEPSVADSTIKRKRNYRAALHQLLGKLRANPEAVGVIMGNYYDRPSPRLKRNLVEAQRYLEQNGLPKTRYFVRLHIWTGNYPGDEATEPVYPNMFLVQLTVGCNQKRFSF